MLFYLNVDLILTNKIYQNRLLGIQTQSRNMFDNVTNSEKILTFAGPNDWPNLRNLIDFAYSSCLKLYICRYSWFYIVQNF